MECQRCKQVVHWEDPELSTDTTQILPGIEGILCPTCGLCIGLNHVQEWIPIKECLLDSSQADGWCLAEGLWDRAIHWILSQFIYRTVEPPNLESRETLFDVPDPTDVIYLLWIGGKAAGFCTLKPTGAHFERTSEKYAMFTIDTIFVRSSYRRRGHVKTLLLALSESHNDIGFSQPVSDSMVKVLWKFLTENRDHRRRFWEISGAGNEGCRKLLWYILRHRCKNWSTSQDKTAF
ncbi:soluble lamin-associated protein of 75 kDa isoform X2 [Frankliniella occidentalis]|uniref:Soluble lamin-associated protein of 75 kDa isoform X2 n=1 Tax=Frankliniella occidentalis TaxID=133901 RepID=A0A6J1SGR0_FRAOC|nr:soluble lamin-associated protein of 75 kDa isoform X2 [Frankliniella occidentalis]